MAGPTIHPWAILTEVHRLRWGGDLRRHFIFQALARRTGGRVVDGWSARAIRPALRRPRGHVWTRPARVASCEMLDSAALDLVRQRGVPAVLDVHDDPVIHRQALGMTGTADGIAQLTTTRDANYAAFHWLISQSASFTTLAGLDPERTIIAPNATDTSAILPGPWPAGPVVGFVSGAAPGRGIETLIAAAGLARQQFANLRLQLWLVATGTESERYLAVLREASSSTTWVEISSAPYERLSEALAQATVLVIPHPPSSYWDAILPIKLFDSMAAGRPLVVTPRSETAQLVDRTGVGLVTDDDDPDTIAAAVCRLLGDLPAARAMGARAREVAIREFDWRVVSERLADQILSARSPNGFLRRLRGS